MIDNYALLTFGLGFSPEVMVYLGMWPVEEVTQFYDYIDFFLELTLTVEATLEC